MGKMQRAHNMFTRYRGDYQEVAYQLWQPESVVQNARQDQIVTWPAQAVTVPGQFFHKATKLHRHIFGGAADNAAVLEIRPEELTDLGITLAYSDWFTVAGVDYRVVSVVKDKLYGDKYLLTYVAMESGRRV